MVTFAERVAYQYAIEEVYWRHRIWPRDNPQAKPPLDEVISREQVEKKVENYLRKSQQIADQQGSPITGDQLQEEIDRMAAHTKDPEVLRELFAALNNDPFVIAECLARPIFLEQLEATDQGGSRSSLHNGTPDYIAIENDLWPAPAGFVRVVTDRPVFAYRLPEVSLGCFDDTWSATSSVNAPDTRRGQSAVWTGSEMIIWGGDNVSGHLNSGSKYDPATDSWRATNTANAPSARWLHSAVWTGTEMIVWGGGSSTMPFFSNTGGRYNPTADNWTVTNTSNVPAGRDYHTAVWTGSEMIVWGGFGCYGDGCIFNSGGRYNPTTDSWIATSTTNAPAARFDQNAEWTGSEMIVWGGADGIPNHTYLHTGGRYNPATDSWTATGLMNVPLGRDGFTAVWSGNEMIVWGGVDETFNASNTGGRYDPVNDSWVATSLTSAPSPRADQTAVWTGNEMIVWAGNDTRGFFNNGGRYDPNINIWTPTATVNAPGARSYSTAVWTSSQMIVWGGLNDVGTLNTGGTYCAQAPVPIVNSAISRKMHGQFGFFDIALPLSGSPGVECRSGGPMDDYSILVWFTATVTVNGNPQAAITSGTATIGSSGVPNGGRVLVADNLVTIPLTNVANAQTINVTLYGVNGSTNFVIPMSILIGDTNGNGAVNASDISQTKLRIGHQLTGTNFRCDVTANGFIDSADISLLKSKIGTGLP